MPSRAANPDIVDLDPADSPDTDTNEAPDQPVTFDELVGKKQRIAKLPIYLPDGKGGNIKRVYVLKAISGPAYDDLVEKYPPNREEAARGANYNADNFMPALVSECSHNPRLTLNQAQQLRTHPAWSNGEFATLFIASQQLCLRGMDAPFIVNA